MVDIGAGAGVNSVRTASSHTTPRSTAATAAAELVQFRMRTLSPAAAAAAGYSSELSLAVLPALVRVPLEQLREVDSKVQYT